MDMRRKNVDWQLKTNQDGSVPHQDAHLAVLMDLRDELQKLNRLLHCSNFIEIPRILRAIRRNITKPRRKKKS